MALNIPFVEYAQIGHPYDMGHGPRRIEINADRFAILVSVNSPTAIPPEAVIEWADDQYYKHQIPLLAYPERCWVIVMKTNKRMPDFPDIMVEMEGT